jgi:hypothetical protein
MIKKQNLIFILIVLALVFSFVSIAISHSDSGSHSQSNGQPSGNVQLYILPSGANAAQTPSGSSP